MSTGTGTVSGLVPGARVTAEIGGSVPVYLPDSIFRERLVQQLRMVALNVESVTVSSGYGLSERDYKATAIVTVQAPTTLSAVISNISSAAEGAGSYTPTVTVPSVGQPSQPSVKPGPVDSIVDAVVDATRNVADVPKDLFQGINLIVIGLVAIVVVVAFGPNVKDIARSVR